MTRLLSQEKRGEAIGFIIAGSSASYALGAFIVPYLQNLGGWRVSFFGYMLPISRARVYIVNTHDAIIFPAFDLNTGNTN
jgi:MFS family permease